MSIYANSFATLKIMLKVFFLTHDHTQSPEIIKFVIIFAYLTFVVILIPSFVLHWKDGITECRVKNASNKIWHSVQ